ncbi:MAG: WG repeat-containing protein [Phycisphaerales bacterium]|nr:WG repeat-containing protein [Phycisphaerales bacterium]
MKIPKLLKLKKITLILLMIGTLPAIYITSILWIAGINNHYEQVWSELQSYGDRHNFVRAYKQPMEPADLIHFYDEQQTFKRQNGLTSKMQGFKDPNGNIVLPAIYHFADKGFYEGLAYVGQGNRRGFIYPDGSWAFETNFTHVDGFINGRARVRMQSNLGDPWQAGFIDKDGNIAVEVKYLRVRDYIGLYTIVKEPTVYNPIWESLMDGLDINIGPIDFLFPPGRSRFLDKDGNRVSPREVKQWMKDNE